MTQKLNVSNAVFDSIEFGVLGQNNSKKMGNYSVFLQEG